MADVVSTGEVFSSTDAQREIWDVVSEVAEGTALMSPAFRPGVAYTPSGAHTESETIAGMTVSGIADGGVGLDALQCSVATDGTYEFPVTGATSSTPRGTQVYAIMGTAGDAGKVTGLTLTKGSNKLFGVVNPPQGYVVSAAKCPVKIGVVAAEVGA